MSEETNMKNNVIRIILEDEDFKEDYNWKE